MTREQKIEMFALKLDGFSLEEIGQHFGITRERVRQILDVMPKCTFSKKRVPCKFPNIEKYLVANRMSYQRLVHQSGISYPTIYHSLIKGSTPDIKKATIDALLAVLKMPYEVAFAADLKSTCDND